MRADAGKSEGARGPTLPLAICDAPGERFPRQRDRGVTAVLAAFFFVTIGGFMALALNMGLALDTRGELQNASDSTALAGAGSLNGISSGLTAARSMANTFSGQHLVTNQAVSIDYAGSDVLFGAWHFTGGTTCAFSGGDCAFGFESAPLSPSTTDIQRINAVKILNGRDGTGSHNSALPVFFHGLLGRNTVSVGSHAVAVGPGAIVDECAVPFVLPLCDVTCGVESRRCPGESTHDTIGLVNLWDLNGGTSVGNMVTMLLGACNPPAPITTGDYDLGNGSNYTENAVLPAMFGLERVGNRYYKRADCLVGSIKAFPVTDATGCAGFSGEQPIFRFVSARINKVHDNAGNCFNSTHCPTGYALNAEVPWPPAGDPACFDSSNCGTAGNSRSITTELICNSGGLTPPTTSVVLRLVE